MLGGDRLKKNVQIVAIGGNPNCSESPGQLPMGMQRAPVAVLKGVIYACDGEMTRDLVHNGQSYERNSRAISFLIIHLDLTQLPGIHRKWVQFLSPENLRL